MKRAIIFSGYLVARRARFNSYINLEYRSENDDVSSDSTSDLSSSCNSDNASVYSPLRFGDDTDNLIKIDKNYEFFSFDYKFWFHDFFYWVGLTSTIFTIIFFVIIFIKFYHAVYYD